jgi:hypothetical protein
MSSNSSRKVAPMSDDILKVKDEFVLVKNTRPTMMSKGDVVDSITLAVIVSVMHCVVRVLETGFREVSCVSFVEVIFSELFYLFLHS